MDLQALSRAYRIGQNQKVTSIHLIIEDTLEEVIEERRKIKLKLSQTLLKKEDHQNQNEDIQNEENENPTDDEGSKIFHEVLFKFIFLLVLR